MKGASSYTDKPSTWFPVGRDHVVIDQWLPTCTIRPPVGDITGVTEGGGRTVGGEGGTMMSGCADDDTVIFFSSLRACVGARGHIGMAAHIG